MTKLYWAYGSNLNHASMARRCPGATAFQALTLDDAQLVFRSVADVESMPGAKAQGGLWHITDECERALDVYEGVRSGLYSKLYLKLAVNGKPTSCLFYQMNESGIMPPSPGYLGTIRQGYADFGLDTDALDEAVDYAWKNQYRSSYLIGRHKRNGEEPVVPPPLGSRVCLTRDRQKYGRLIVLSDDGVEGTIKWDDGTTTKAPVHKMRMLNLQKPRAIAM